MDYILSRSIERLRKMLEETPPPPQIFGVAKVTLYQYPRTRLPDWVEILARGNPKCFEDVIETARSDLHDKTKY